MHGKSVKIKKNIDSFVAYNDRLLVFKKTKI